MVVVINPTGPACIPEALITERDMSDKRSRGLLRLSGVVIGAALLLSGCALPPALTIASYAIDGFSYLTSGKSVSDHALSAVTSQDCALFRAVMGNDICRDRDEQMPDGTAIAAADLSRIEPASGPVSWEWRDDSGDSGYQPVFPPAPMLASAIEADNKGIVIEGLSQGTEVFALMQADGALEVFAHDPRRSSARANLRMILKVEDYRNQPGRIEGFRLNGAFYAINDIVV